jgi:hypothetical protein
MFAFPITRSARGVYVSAMSMDFGMPLVLCQAAGSRLPGIRSRAPMNDRAQIQAK